MQAVYGLVLVTLIICLFLVWFFSHRAQHREKMLKIEKGLEPRSTDSAQPKRGFSWIRLAWTVTGLSIGMLIIALLAGNGWLDKWGNALPLGILGISGGSALLLSHYTDSKK